MFRIFKNKFLCFSLIILTLGVLFYVVNYTPLVHITSTNTDSHKSYATTYEYFQEKMNEHEQLTWDIVQTDTRVTKDECFQKQKKDYPAYKKSLEKNWQYKRSHYPKLKQETITIVKDVLRDFDINPADIQIVPYKGKGSPAAADDSTIFIDEDECAHFSLEACKFVIAHEISHLQAQDESLYQSLYSLSQTKRTSKRKKKEALEAFRRFQETRADICALLHGGKKYAQGAFDFMYKLQELDGGDNPGITHPKTSIRLKNARKLCTMMGWNVPALQA